MGFNIFEKIVDKIQVFFSFKTGDKKSANFVARGNINIGKIVLSKDSEKSGDVIEQKARVLIKDKNEKAKIIVALGISMGIVKALERPGTRVHLDFAVLNEEDKPTVVQGAYMKINEGVVHFKLFYNSDATGARQPNLGETFPIVVAANGVARLQIEFENIKQELIHKGDNACEIYVLTARDSLSSTKFKLVVDDAMIQTFEQLQSSADNTRIPAIFPAAITTMK